MTAPKDMPILKKLALLPFEAKVLGASFVAMAGTVCWLLSSVWRTRTDYNFGFIVPVFVAYVIWDRSEAIFNFFFNDSDALPLKREKFWRFSANAFFGAMLVCGLFTYLLFAWIFYLTQNMGSPAFAMTFGFSFTAFAMFYFAAFVGSGGKKKTLRESLAFLSIFTFPSFVWLVSAPMIGTLEEKISLALLSIVSEVVYEIMYFLGYVVTLRANVLEFPNGSVGVADACSGIRSLTACLFAGSFLAAVMLDKFWKKVALVVLSMFFAFFNNILRAMFLSFWAYEFGSDSISGEVHDIAGYFVLGMTVIGLLIFVALFQLNPVPKHLRGGGDSSASGQ